MVHGPWGCEPLKKTPDTESLLPYQERPPLIFIAGRDPTVEIGGGHASYVRSHAFAARAAGYAPKLYCVSEQSGTSELEYGSVIRVPARGRPCRQTRVGFHAPALVQAILRDLATTDEPVLIHSFGVWGHVGGALKTALNARAQTCFHVMSMYTTYADEAEAHLRSAVRYGLRAGLAQWLELQWIRLRVAPLEHAALKHADRVTVNYQSVARLIRDRYPDISHIEQMTYGPETAFTEPELSATRSTQTTESTARREHPAPPRLLTIALQRPKKGVDTLLHGLARALARGARFEAKIVGGGPLVPHHKQLAHTLKLDGAVTLTGFVPDVVPDLKAADIFVLPSRREESGSIAVLQAMQAGCAIVCSDIDGLREDLVNGQTALLIPPDDPKALADALHRLITDLGLRQRLAQNAHAAFSARFCAAAQSEASATLYQSLLMHKN